MPNEEQQSSSKGRIMSIDALRGFDMFWIIGGSAIFSSLHDIFENPTTEFIKTQFIHVEWEGFRFIDLVMPLFLFIVGVVMPFAFNKRLRQGHSKSRLYRHIIIRFLILYILGMIAQGRLLEYDLSQLRIFSNTLQAIANSHGFGSTEDPDKALHAAYCAAAPGALVRFTDLVVDPEEWSRLPETFREKWSKIVCTGWSERLTEAGFEIETHEFVSGPLIDPEEGGLPNEANALGFRLHKSFEYIRARKPG